MINGREKLFATAIIWTAMVLIAVLGNLDLNNFISLGILLAVGGGVTAEVWKASGRATNTAEMISEPEKAKRTEKRRISHLVDSLSEDDVATLEAVLAARRDQFDEDEQIELNRLLADQKRSQS